MRTPPKGKFVTAVLLGMAALVCAASAKKKPNIVLILADDYGYGDVEYLNPEGCKVPTPNLDQLAREGISFSDAHSGSSCCTPTRYGLLTGRYAWRTHLQKGVLLVKGKPLIAPGRMTVGEMLQEQGYHTACIGKWHLGVEWVDPKDYNQGMVDGPTSHGFDYYYGPDVPNFEPHCFFENKQVVGGRLELVKRGKKGRAQATLPGWQVDRILPTITQKAVEYVREQAATPEPFFLFFSLTSPHEPVAPSERFLGKSGISKIADFMMETDWAAGEVVRALDQAGLKDNTLVIFTADNGHATYTDMKSLTKVGHTPSGIYRGYKSSIWEGGHREPFFARWPGEIKPGTRSAQLICLTDFMATCADILEVTLPDNAAEDSSSILPALLGKAEKPIHESIVNHSSTGIFAIRKGRWKLIFGPGSGSRYLEPTYADALEAGLPKQQLYDLSKDPSEKHNLVANHPEVVQELTQLLEHTIDNGRSTPGEPGRNDVPVKYQGP